VILNVFATCAGPTLIPKQRAKSTARSAGRHPLAHMFNVLVGAKPQKHSLWREQAFTHETLKMTKSTSSNHEFS
jgi:hypothetical protein